MEEGPSSEFRGRTVTGAAAAREMAYVFPGAEG